MASAIVGREEEEQGGALEAFLRALSLMETPESRKIGLSFQPQQGDIFVVTHPKCGTTWLQQVRPCVEELVANVGSSCFSPWLYSVCYLFYPAALPPAVEGRAFSDKEGWLVSVR